MLLIIDFENKKYQCDLSEPIDISIPLRSGTQNPNAFGIQNPHFEAYQSGGFIGSVQAGGSVNCENLLINAHGNGTHTECVGHISKERITINQTLKKFFFTAQLLTVDLTNNYIAANTVIPQIKDGVEALIIRTSPNGKEKLEKQYSGNNPAYVEPALCQFLCDKKIKHFLLDLPSVDPEQDDGKLSAHHAFWNYPENARMDATITEMIYAPDEVKDGIYVLNIQIASIESDASPSKPVLYRLSPIAMS